MKFGIYLCAFFYMTAQPCFAKCVVDYYRFQFGADTSTTAHLTNGGRCKITFSFKKSALQSIAITTPAKHGAASTNGGLAYPEVYYVPKPGFTGDDSFVFTMKGVARNGEGVTNVTVSVVAQ